MITEKVLGAYTIVGTLSQLNKRIGIAKQWKNGISAPLKCQFWLAYH